MEVDSHKHNVEQFKIKKLIKKLEEARGNGTSMISLILPPKKQMSDVNKMLTDEFGKAANIKDRVNRQSVQTAITSAKERLKLYNKTPNNGLVLFCGNVLEADGRTEKKLVIDFEPFKAINTSLYYCDSIFHVEDLKCLLDTDPPFGFIVVDGNGALFATLQGNTREILHKFTVELPKKHGRGGQSSVRFARLRLEKRHNYLRKVCEVATQVFIQNDKSTVSGLILAGSADFKHELNTSSMFDPRLGSKVIKMVDVSYGGENGLNQAIELSQESLQNVKFVQEKQLISSFFQEIAVDSGKFCSGVVETMRCLEEGAIQTLIVFEGLEFIRMTLRNKETGKLSFVYLKPDQLTDPKHYVDPDTKVQLESVEQELLTEWIAEHYQNYGSELEFVTNKSPEGFQFSQGFGGIGGILRYKLDVDFINGEEYLNDNDDDFI